MTNYSLRYFGKAIESVKKAMDYDSKDNLMEAKQYYKETNKFLFLARDAKDAKEDLVKVCLKRAEECQVRIDQIDKILSFNRSHNTANKQNERTNINQIKNNRYIKSAVSDNDVKTDYYDDFQIRLEANIVVEKPDVRFDDIAGLEAAKQALKEAIILPIKVPQLFTGERKPWRRILLYGPPGTGKSFIAKACANHATNSTYITVSSSDLLSKWLGESEKLVRGLFELARKRAPSIIFIDEIDSLLCERSDQDSESSRRIKNEFLLQLDGFNTSLDGVFFLAATNLPEKIDHAIRRRFEKKIYIPLPDIKARLKIVKDRLNNTANELTEEDFEWIAENTEGFSGSDLAILTRQASMLSINAIEKASYFIRRGDLYEPADQFEPGAEKLSICDSDFPTDELHIPMVNREHFEKALLNIKPSISRDALTKYDDFTKSFGEYC